MHGDIANLGLQIVINPLRFYPTSQTFVHVACISLPTSNTKNVCEEATEIKKTKILAAMLVDNKITNKTTNE